MLGFDILHVDLRK
jgi:hypothetical protein